MPYTFKKKRGYTLKKGKSGEMRWHKDQDPAPTKLRLKRQYSTDIAEMMQLDLHQREIKRDRSYSDVNKSFVLNPIIMESDRLLTRDNTLYVPGDSRNIDKVTGYEYKSGIGYNALVGIKDRAYDHNKRADLIIGEPTIMGKMLRIFSDNADESITPDLPTIAELAARRKSEVSKMMDDVMGERHGSVILPKDETFIDRNIASELIDLHIASDDKVKNKLDTMRSEAIDMGKSGDDSWSMAQIPNFLGKNVNIPLSLMDLRSRKSFATRKLYEELGKAGMGLPSYVKDISDISFETIRLNGGVGKMTRNLSAVYREVDKKAQENPQVATALEDLRDIMRTEERHSRETAAATQGFYDLVVNNYIDNLDIQPTHRSYEEMADDAKEVVQSIANYNRKLDISGTMNDEEDAMVPDFTHNIFNNNFSTKPGIAKVNPVSRFYIPIADTVAGDHNNVIIHEMTHAIDTAESIISGVLKKDSFLYKSQPALDLNKAEASEDYPYYPGKLDEVENRVRNDMISVNQGKLKEVALARKSIMDDLGKIADASLDSELVDRKMGRSSIAVDKNGYSIRDENGDLIITDTPNAPIYKSGLLNLSPAPIGLSPELDRLMYAIRIGRGGSESSSDAYVKSRKEGVDEHEFATVYHPEAVTVLVEYALGAPHVLEALDGIFKTNLRGHINRFLGVSIVKKSDPVLLANARINILAAMSAGPRTIYKENTNLYLNQLKKGKKAISPFQPSFDKDYITGEPARRYVKKASVERKYRRK